MANLTNTSIGKMQPPISGKQLVFDDHKDAPRGFGLKLTPAGAKVFFLRYTVDGKQRLKTIGHYPSWTVEAARAEGRRLVQQVDQGGDPLEAKRQRRLAPTVADLADEWLQKHASGLRSEKAIRGYILNDLVSEIGRLKVTDVRRRDVLDAVEKKAQTTTSAARQLLLYAKRLFEYAVDRDVIPASPVAGLKPSAIKVEGKRNPLKPSTRDRVLSREEVRSFWNRGESSEMHKLTALALKTILITGQRPGEVAGMRWDEIDGETWTIPAQRRGKTNTAHSVHLTATALAVLAAAKAEVLRLSLRRRKEPTGVVFETRPGSSITVAALDRAVSRLGWDWTPHDLRRTMRTGLSACRIRPDIAEMTIGHTKKGIIAVYDLHEYEDERRQALRAWEAHLLGMVNDNVVSLVKAVNT